MTTFRFREVSQHGRDLPVMNLLVLADDDGCATTSPRNSLISSSRSAMAFCIITFWALVIVAGVVAPLIAYRGDRRALLVAYIVLTDAVVLRQPPRNVA